MDLVRREFADSRLTRGGVEGVKQEEKGRSEKVWWRVGHRSAVHGERCLM